MSFVFCHPLYLDMLASEVLWNLPSKTQSERPVADRTSSPASASFVCSLFTFPYITSYSFKYIHVSVFVCMCIYTKNKLQMS